MKYIIIICLLIVGCGCHQNQPLCRTGDYQDRSVKKAIVQQSQPYPTLRVIIDTGKPIAVILTQIDLDALECSISQYRQNHGYAHRNDHVHGCGCGGHH